jgi:endonuclease/exonuclease/phosphatase (EEP) superfamily protein YafD
LLESPDIAGRRFDTPCIVGGDMNDWRGVLWRQRFKKAGFLCASNRHEWSRWSIKTFPSYAPTAGLDKIFYRGPLRRLHVYRSRLKSAKIASDHLPLIAEFEI